VPDATARQSSIPTATSGSPGRGDELVTRVVRIDYVSATQLVPILRPLIPQQGHMAAFPSSNVLIVSDRAENIARIMKLIRRIDRPGNDDVEVISLQHASAAELVRILSALNKQNTTAKGGSPELVLVADERTNSILLSGDKANRLRLRALVSHLYTSNDGVGDTQVIFLKHADAKSLVPVLTSVSNRIGADKKNASAAASTSLPIHLPADDTIHCPGGYRACRLDAFTAVRDPASGHSPCAGSGRGRDSRNLHDQEFRTRRAMAGERFCHGRESGCHIAIPGQQRGYR